VIHTVESAAGLFADALYPGLIGEAGRTSEAIAKNKNLRIFIRRTSPVSKIRIAEPIVLAHNTLCT
jgi:hypothetical protein